MIGLVGLAAGSLLEIRRLRRGGTGNNDAQTKELRKAVEVRASSLLPDQR